MTPKQLVRLLKSEGWTVRCNKGHYRAYAPDPSIPPVTFASTPSDFRSMKNAVARIRRHGVTIPHRGHPVR